MHGMFTAQDVVDVNGWVRLPKQLPSADNTRGRVNECAVHVK